MTFSGQHHRRLFEDGYRHISTALPAGPHIIVAEVIRRAYSEDYRELEQERSFAGDPMLHSILGQLARRAEPQLLHELVFVKLDRPR